MCVCAHLDTCIDIRTQSTSILSEEATLPCLRINQSAVAANGSTWKHNANQQITRTHTHVDTYIKFLLAHIHIDGFTMQTCMHTVYVRKSEGIKISSLSLSLRLTCLLESLACTFSGFLSAHKSCAATDIDTFGVLPSCEGDSMMQTSEPLRGVTASSWSHPTDEAKQLHPGAAL